MMAAEVLGLGLWTPGYPSVEAWRLEERDEDARAPKCAIIPSRHRRATSLTTRMGGEVIGQALSAAEVELEQVKLIFGSAYGEFQTAVAQLEMIESEDGRLSPARFKNSVHNTVTGLLSIALKNQGFGTAIASGEATFAMVLLEALTLLELEGGTVVAAVADEPPPPPFHEKARFAPLGFAVCLGAEGAEPKGMATVRDLRRRADFDTPSLPPTLAKNPAAAGFPLLEALLGGYSGAVALELGDKRPWSLEVEPRSGRS